MRSHMNETMAKFGYPSSLVKDYTSWVLLIRSRQVTLGSLVLCVKGKAQSFSQVMPQEYAELTKVTADLESALQSLWKPEKVNYLALMMVDPHVHFHVIPRYALPRRFDGFEYVDKGWPKHPDMGASAQISEQQLEQERYELYK